MQNDPLEEILEEERRPSNKRKQKKSNNQKKNVFGRILIGFILIALFAFGAMYALQALLDVEAEIKAAAIATSNVSMPVNENPQGKPSGLPIAPPASVNIMPARTATISAQLTAVAEFQLTVTPSP